MALHLVGVPAHKPTAAANVKPAVLSIPPVRVTSNWIEIAPMMGKVKSAIGKTFTPLVRSIVCFPLVIYIFFESVTTAVAVAGLQGLSDAARVRVV